MSTDTSAFWVSNQAWDGASELQRIPAESGAESTILTNASHYDSLPPPDIVTLVVSPAERYASTESNSIRQFVREECICGLT